MKSKFTILLLLQAFIVLAQNTGQKYLVGAAKQEITYSDEDKIGLFGYGYYPQRTDSLNPASSQTYTRAITIKDPATGKRLIYVHADLGAIFNPIVESLLKRLKADDPSFDPTTLMVVATHTHTAPSGCSYYSSYMLPTPGIKPKLIEFYGEKMYLAVKEAQKKEKLATINIKKGSFPPEVPVIYNRSLQSYNLNPEIPQDFKQEDTHLAANREVLLFDFQDTSGKTFAVINFFGLHINEILNFHNFINGNSKGYAGMMTEEMLGVDAIAIYAQTAAGDVISADYHNIERFNKQMGQIIGDPNFHAYKEGSIEHAKWGGKTNADKTMEILKNPTQMQIHGGLASTLAFVDMSNVSVDTKFKISDKEERTSSPTMGIAALAYTNAFDDKHTPAKKLFTPIYGISQFIFAFQKPFLSKEDREYYKHLMESQSPKKIMLNGETKSTLGMRQETQTKNPFQKMLINQMASLDPAIQEFVRQRDLGALEEHTSLIEVLPNQIFRIGNVVIVGLATEITTIAAQRLQKAVLDEFKGQGVDMVIISSYANEYSGYTTTYEEYQNQRYEAGHTVYGKYQLAAFQTVFSRLAKDMVTGQKKSLDYGLRPPVFSQHELELRSNLKPLEGLERKMNFETSEKGEKKKVKKEK
ncbi:MAG: hypothetical protein C4K58_06375 [Flavobacteriaceae bacterium]|nr:MAG: hypothetical protein C4K58_06375 [Flavobacteriaceae bacterium]